MKQIQRWQGRVISVTDHSDENIGLITLIRGPMCFSSLVYQQATGEAQLVGIQGFKSLKCLLQLKKKNTPLVENLPQHILVCSGFYQPGEEMSIDLNRYIFLHKLLTNVQCFFQLQMWIFSYSSINNTDRGQLVESQFYKNE